MSFIVANWQSIGAIAIALIGVINLIAHFILRAEHKDTRLVTDDIADWLLSAKGAIDRGAPTPRLPESVSGSPSSSGAIPPPISTR